MTTSDRLWAKGLLLIRFGIRGDVCGLKWRPRMFTFLPERSPDPKLFTGGELLKEITNAENHDVGLAGSSGEVFR
jgi:hypothetical protein